ncbi:MAG: putative hydroxymethylpyrimidine transporter CytX [Kiritimatiellae bacterium]|nr:putative hydroxymethylpyrimidine transporter CytX [Kiritimatiellia bacterium]MDW8459282.1 putative hydroxymethylpyrimidine transporter CytX [Verrucomicrobiota bacterium]
MTSNPSSTSIEPPASAGDSSNRLRGREYFFLWAGAAIALSEIWAGGLLAPLGLSAGLAVIILGRLIGNLPMAIAGHIGAVTGEPSMVTTRGALGRRGSYLPAALNVLQLIGWTAVMLWIGGQAASKLAPSVSADPRVWVVAIGVLTTLWALGGPRVWRRLQQISVILLALLCVAMTVLFVSKYDLGGLLREDGRGGMPFMVALDLAIAMPISWMPLAADYARHAASPRGAFWGTYLGYFAGGVWMYALGIAAAIAANSNTPDAVLMGMMAEAGWAAAALVIVLISTVTTTFLDVYSHAVSLSSIREKISVRTGILLCGGLGTLFALFMDPTRYEHFLLMIGSVFCPLFGVVLVDFFVRHRGRYDARVLRAGSVNPVWNGFNIPGVAAWVIGCIAFHAIAGLAAWLGASLPSMAVSGFVYFVFSLKRDARS